MSYLPRVSGLLVLCGCLWLAGSACHSSTAQVSTGSGGQGGAGGSVVGNDASLATGGVTAMGGSRSGSAGNGGMSATGGVPATGGATTASGAGGAGGSSSDSAGSVSVPALSNLTIEPNPNNSLSCFVAWTTDVPANSEVQFGEAAYQFHIVTEEAVTAHRVLVIGMHAETSYLIKAVSTDAAGSGSAEGSFKAGALPTGLPVGTQTQSDTSGAQAGWTLTNIMPASTSPIFTGTAPGIIVMVDMQGLPVWYFVNGTTIDERGDVSLRVLPNHNIMLGPSSGEPPKEIDLAGNVLWQGPPSTPSGPSTDPASAPQSHYAGKLENGNYVIIRTPTNADGISGALVEELTSANEIVWSWNLFDHMQPPADAADDWCHPNSVTIDLASDVLYLSCRYQGIIKAKRSGDQAVLWVLGGGAGGDFAFDPATADVTDQHDPEIHADGTILLYDNHGEALVQPADTTTRVIELKLDEVAKVARPTFEFPGSFSSVNAWYTSIWYTPYWGDADRLANGDVLVTAGIRSQTVQTRLFEVRPSDGAIVWQITWPAGVGSYQAERWSPPPLVEEL
jgi:hypothetical protein